MSRNRQRIVKYLIVRQHVWYGWKQFHGPLYSCPADIRSDAQRLFGGDYWTVSWSSWSSATVEQKAEAKERQTAKPRA